ncbi:hypothetical protein KR054_008070 [Drosophila jambulina]|nr:hypothetical protein KR054_008070 [Drosophila jambulina]
MGGKQSKADDNTANVVNTLEVVDTTPHLNAQYMLLLILVIISALNLALKLYLLHKRSLKKTYMSRAKSNRN